MINFKLGVDIQRSEGGEEVADCRQILPIPRHFLETPPLIGVALSSLLFFVSAPFRDLALSLSGLSLLPLSRQEGTGGNEYGYDV
ncbi:MAG: hypothetical protein C3F11_19455 [Methylocystaceae bacterium]|nr:MAG: hypothetical protein C3F11_19455 [Methylocystaceae bacterium]